MTTDSETGIGPPQRRSRSGRSIVRTIGRFLFGLLLGLVLLSALSNVRLPTQSQTVERLHPLEKARVAEATHLRRTLGDTVWPGWGEMEIPVIVYNEGYAFLTGYENPPPGWRTVPGGEQHGGPWEPVPADTFDGAAYYRQPLPGDVTPQAFTVRVGERSVASLATMEWMKIGLRESIREQLPGVLAWLVPYRLLDRVFLGSSDWYIASLLHESFHAYQNVVAPAHLAAAEEAAGQHERRYPWEDEQLRAAWQAELDVLSAGVRAPAAEAPAYARRFLALREQRRSAGNLTPELVRYEQQREWLEGLAKYSELAIWREAATAEGYEPLPVTAKDAWFKGYRGTFEQRWSQEVDQIKRMAGDEGDGRFYYSGWAQAVLLDRLLPGWKSAALLDGTSPEALLERAVASQP